MKEEIRRHLQTHIDVSQKVLDSMGEEIGRTADILIACIEKGGTIFLCGNGGSAADAQHIAAEFTGRYLKSNRTPLPAIALTTDTSALTAIGNDFGIEHIFARQVTALAKPGDVLIGLSTSGNSKNVVEAFRAAGTKNATRILMSGGTGGMLKSEADHCLIVPHSHTPHIQEMHITIGHILCELVDNHFAV
jgi:D-sedoheptulose 7-phosphate isomerase